MSVLSDSDLDPFSFLWETTFEGDEEVDPRLLFILPPLGDLDEFLNLEFLLQRFPAPVNDMIIDQQMGKAAVSTAIKRKSVSVKQQITYNSPWGAL